MWASIVARLKALFVGVEAVAVKDENLVKAIVARKLAGAEAAVKAAEASVVAAVKKDTPALEAAVKEGAEAAFKALESVLASYGIL